MSKQTIYSSDGSLYRMVNGKREPVREFEAPINDCECKLVCCGTTQAIQFTHSVNGIVQIPLEQLYNYLYNNGVIDTVAPTPPSALVTGTITDTSVILNWTASTDTNFTGYKVYKDGVFLANVTKPTVTYTATGLTADTSYVFSVKAVDAGGNLSTAISITTTTDEA